MTPDDYCEDIALRQNAGFRYSLLGLTRPQRQALIAVEAFFLETRQIAETCREPAVARSKLDWWRTELGHLFTGEAHHPISRALQPWLSVFNLPEDYFREILDGVAMGLDYDAYADFTDLTLYLHRYGSVPALLTAEILGYQERRATLRFAHEAGILLILFDLLYETRHHARQGRCYVPDDDMRRFGVAHTDLLAAQTSESLRQLFAFQSERLHAYCRRAMEFLPDIDRYPQCSLLIRLELVLALLAEIAADGYRLLEQRTRLMPLRQLWLAWRLRNRERRHAQGLKVTK